jgi:hypothetical protein
MSGDNAVVGRPGCIGLPLSGSRRRKSIVNAVRDFTVPPAIPAPPNGDGFRDACHGNCAAAWGNTSVGIGLLPSPRPHGYLLCERSPSVDEPHPHPSPCCLHKSCDKAANYPMKAQARLRSIAIDELRFQGRDHENHASCLCLDGASLGCPRPLLHDSATPTVTDLRACQCHEVTTLIC